MQFIISDVILFSNVQWRRNKEKENKSPYWIDQLKLRVQICFAFYVVFLSLTIAT